MYRRARTTRWPSQVAVIVLVAVTLAIGLCLLDAHQHDMSHHGMSPDLCLGFIALVFAVTLLGLAEIDRLPAELLCPVRAVSVHRLDPPPKSVPIS
jgi:hypothetical protein